ncbi:hypothetical protein FHX49_000363 [Microbacterium endophyticum]|uniref:Uncharacterized protein n=1 Tax=Microbacterium endophyticum TaxID=1526412 RepID=A0A7W4V0W3_9MICO|nr:hypothetical protein [Microbacterium endophyticum]MBB2974822.1 hypothetical protein [Microbacterium endophyticum]NIK37119.1 hypothetical protein [Microbacterium endophyticum]
MSESQEALIVRYSLEARGRYEETLAPLVRKQSVLLIVVGCLFAFMAVVVPAIALSMDGTAEPLRVVIGLGILSLIPIVLIVLGVRRLRLRPTLPDIAFTISSDSVVFSRREKTTLLSRTRPELRWDRRATTVRADTVGPKADEVLIFTTKVGGATRSERQTTDVLDTPVAEIVAAVQAP